MAEGLENVKESAARVGQWIKKHPVIAGGIILAVAVLGYIAWKNRATSSASQNAVEVPGGTSTGDNTSIPIDAGKIPDTIPSPVIPPDNTSPYTPITPGPVEAPINYPTIESPYTAPVTSIGAVDPFVPAGVGNRIYEAMQSISLQSLTNPVYGIAAGEAGAPKQPLGLASGRAGTSGLGKAAAGVTIQGMAAGAAGAMKPAQAPNLGKASGAVSTSRTGAVNSGNLATLGAITAPIIEVVKAAASKPAIPGTVRGSVGSSKPLGKATAAAGVSQPATSGGLGKAIASISMPQKTTGLSKVNRKEA